MQPRRLITRGEVWQADLNPIVGHEQAGIRPIIIVSSSHFNQNSARLLIVVPVTRTSRPNPLHVEIAPPDGGLRYPSFALCDMVRSVSQDRLQFFIGRLERESLDEIGDRLSIMLDL